MQYENFSRHLRKKYSTRFHVADQLVDQLKYRDQTQILSTSTYDLNEKNLIKAQREISFPLISYLNKFDCEQLKSIENNNNEFEPYFNECILAAERIRNNQRSNRDRQICYENLVLTQKLERIKKQSKNKDCKDHYQLLLSKVNHGYKSLCSAKKKLPVKQSHLSNTLDIHRDKFSEIIDIYHSSKSPVSPNEDDQATAADVDGSIGSSDFDSTSRYKLRKTLKKNRNFNCTKSNNDDGIYQHLNKIDMTMVRDTIPLAKSQHFPISIPLRDNRTTIKLTDNYSKVLSQNQKCAFKQETLYP